MNEISLANFFRVLNQADRFPTEKELADAAIAAKDELNALRRSPAPGAQASPKAEAQGAAEPVAWVQGNAPFGSYQFSWGPIKPLITANGEWTPIYPAPVASPPPPREAVAQEVASEVLAAIRTLRQDVRPYMRHLDDCELVKFRKGDHALNAKVPPCNCGLERVLWDVPAETQAGKTK